MRVGSLLRSPAIGADGRPLPHADYLNTAAVGYTTLAPEEILGVAKRIEYLAGRRPGPRDAPRCLDIDLLLYGEELSHRPELTLPHPRLAQRRFALLPVAELLPDLRLPPEGTPIHDLLTRLGDLPHERVERLAWSRPPGSLPAERPAPPASPRPGR